MYTFRCLFALLVQLVSLVQAHTAFTTLFVNGLSQGDGTCIRMNTVSGRVNFPIADITSDDMACGQSGLQPVARTCPIKVGDTVSFQFRSGPGSNSTESIVEGHKGPCGVYMKQISSGDTTHNGLFPAQSPVGDGWFKIMYDSVDSQDQWCTERVNHTAEGVITTNIPSDLAPGYYLLRPELLALHAATNRDPQFYTGCAQVYISGGTGHANPDKTSIPGYVKYTDQAMSWNLYNQTGAKYPEYGPKLYKENNVTGQVSVPATTISTEPPVGTSSCTRRKRYNYGSRRAENQDTSQDEFACPANTILELGNLCLPEVPHWKDTDTSMRSCWASQNYCWKISDMCWKTRSPAVSYEKGQGCDLYAQLCTEVGAACTKQVMEGPTENQSLTPKQVTLSKFGVVG